MSLGHMTREEQIITLAGMFVLIPFGFLVGMHYFGEFGAAVGLFAGIALTFAAKVYCWRDTVMDDSLMTGNRGQLSPFPFPIVVGVLIIIGILVLAEIMGAGL